MNAVARSRRIRLPRLYGANRRANPIVSAPESSTSLRRRDLGLPWHSGAIELAPHPGPHV